MNAGKNLPGNSICHRLVVSFIYLTLICFFPLTPTAHSDDDDGCSDIYASLKTEDFLRVEKTILKSSLKMCAVILGESYYEKGELKKARHWFAYARKYADPTVSVTLYRDVLYYNLLLNETVLTPTMEDYYRLKMIDREWALRVRETLRNRFMPLVDEFLSKPFAWSFEYKDLAWVKELGFADNHPVFRRVYSTVYEARESLHESKDASTIENILSSLKDLNGLKVVFNGREYIMDVSSQLVMYEHYKNYLYNASMAKKAKDNQGKARFYRLAHDELGLAGINNISGSLPVRDNENVGSRKKKYSLMDNLDRYFRSSQSAIPGRDVVKNWVKASDSLDSGARPPEEYMDTIRVLARYYEIEETSRFPAFICGNNYSGFLNDPVWQTEFLGRDLLSEHLKEPLQIRIKDNAVCVIHDVERVLRNEEPDFAMLGDLEQSRAVIDCIKESYPAYIDPKFVQGVDKELANLMEYYAHKEKGEDKKAAESLALLPLDIKIARKLEAGPDCSELVTMMRITIESAPDGMPYLETLRKAGGVIPGIDKWNYCLGDSASGFGLLTNELKKEFFEEVMRQAFFRLQANLLAEGKTLISEILESKSYPYRTDENMYIYAKFKSRLFKNIIQQKGAREVQKHFDGNISRVSGFESEFNYFSGEEEIVKNIIKNTAARPIVAIKMGALERSAPKGEKDAPQFDETWRKRRNIGEAHLADFNYGEAVALFNDYAHQSEIDGFDIWKERKRFSEQLLQLERLSRKYGRSKKRFNTVQKKIARSFRDGKLADTSFYKHSIPYFKMESANIDQIKNAHSDHMRYVFWLAFGDARFEQKRLLDAVENYGFALNFAQTTYEKSAAKEKIALASGSLPGKAQIKSNGLGKNEKLFIGIQKLTDRARAGKAKTPDVDQVISDIQKLGGSKKVSLKNTTLADKVCEQLLLAGKALKKSDESLAIMLFLKFLNSEFYKTCDKEMPNIKRMKKYIDEDLFR